MVFQSSPTQTTSRAGPIESRKEYSNAFEYWRDELNGSQEMLKRWHRQADRVEKRFLDERTDTAADPLDPNRADRQSRFRLNLFHSNTFTIYCLLYGKLPKIDVRRRHSDASDDVGRVAATILERMLNNDIEENAESNDSLLRAVLYDHLVPGLGVAKVRYDATFTPSDTETPSLEEEYAETDYFHWRDVLWSWSRSFADLRWMAFRTYLSRDEARERYGEAANTFDYKVQKLITSSQANDAPDKPEDNEPWLRAEIWEIWDKETRTILEVHTHYPKVLKTREDQLQLRDFFPVPPFFMANPTTALYRPTTYFHLSQDLYNEVDKLQTRIAIITEAVKVVGVYDSASPEIKRIFKEGTENDLIPVDKWAMFAEKGGLQGQIDWFPIEDVVNALVNLRQVRDETIELLYQITGMADVMRGHLQNQYEGVGQTQEKTQFASVRMQQLQEYFASFVSRLFQLKAELIARHFSAETIVERSNAAELPEPPERIAEAVALIKTPDLARLRVRIQADSMAIVDYRRMQAERTEFLTALSAFMQAAAPLTEQAPATAPYLMRMLQWGLAGFRGADEIEGVLDEAIEAHAKAQEQPEQPSEDVQREQAKAQGQIQLVQAKAQAEMQTRDHDLQADLKTEYAKHQMEVQKTEAEFRQQASLIELKARADMATETHQSQVNAEQHAQGVEAEMNKDIVDHQLDLQSEVEKTALEIRKTAEVERLKQETNAKTKETPSDD